MKKITLLLLLVGITGIAQINGNKEVTTRSFAIENLTDLEMDLYANVIIDASASEEKIIITGDSNVLSYIDTEVVDGTMKLAQTQWIKPSIRIDIKIAAPNLKRLQLGVHETILLTNVNRESLVLTALLGTIQVEGKTQSVAINAENGIVDARKLEVEETSLSIWGRGKALVNTSEIKNATLSDDASVELTSPTTKMSAVIKNRITPSKVNIDDSVKYIQFKIKNNSWNRNHFVVVGPKKDGSTFSYGFPMMPGAIKKERWTIGTKVYRSSKIGLRKLLITITLENEGELVELFN